MASVIHQGPDCAASEVPVISRSGVKLLPPLLQQIIFLALPGSGGLEPEEGDKSKYTY